MAETLEIRDLRVNVQDKEILKGVTLTINQGEGIAIVNSAETAVGVQPAWGGWCALSFAAQFTKMETIRSERSFSNLVRGLQVYGFKVVTAPAMGRAWVHNGLNA